MISIPKENTYYVSTLDDNDSPNTFRTAICQANQNEISQIIFLISGQIILGKELPSIISQVIIDGTQITGYIKNPLIEIDSNQFNGLFLEKNSHNSVINGLSITNAKNSGITMRSNGNLLINNFIGLTPSGVKKSNMNGISLCCSHNNIIGENQSSISGYASNIISGNKENGIKLCNSSKRNFG